MARNKGGLGRGLNALLGGLSMEAAPQEKPSNRFTVDPKKPVAHPQEPNKDVAINQEKEQEALLEEELVPDSDVHIKSISTREVCTPSCQQDTETNTDNQAVTQLEIPQEFPDEQRIADVVARECSDVPSLKHTSSAPLTSTQAASTTAPGEEPVSASDTQQDSHNVFNDKSAQFITELDLSQIEVNPQQPRTRFQKDELQELADSIKVHGVLQPILVQSLSHNKYKIIAGERRYQASQLAGLKTIPAHVKQTSDDNIIELALIENIQRSDLNPIEEAYGYRRLIEEKGMTQVEIAQAVSKGRSTIANALRLLELPEDAQKLLYEDKISAGHARAILSIHDKDAQKKLTERLMRDNLSVRETEALARLLSGKIVSQAQSTRVPTPQAFKLAARNLRKVLSTNVRVKTVKGKNKIEIEFGDETELNRIVEMLKDGKQPK